MIIWALTDNRPGTRVQVMGVAEKLGLSFEEKPIHYTPLALLPNLLLGASMLGVDRLKSAGLAAPWPDLVIGAGRRTAPIARYIKRHNPSTKLVQLMWPEAGMAEFDLIALPQHDRDHEGQNIIRTLLSPHRLTHEKITKAVAEWRPKFKHLKEPYTSLILGGDADDIRFSAKDMAAIAERANRLARHGSLLITTSRRTNLALLDGLEKALTVPYSLYRHVPNTPNPYLALLGLADQLLVTADSVSMLSEACFTGKPVYAYSPEHNQSRKHKRFLSELTVHGLVQTQDEAPRDTALASAQTLDSASMIAAAVRGLLS